MPKKKDFFFSLTGYKEGLQSPHTQENMETSHAPNPGLAQIIREYATELLRDALENGDAIKTAKDLRASIIIGFNLSLDDIEMPERIKPDFQLPDL